ncbi:hypothetical protein [Undibacterium flavidum]|uniref:Uncharacterized protein n=1 Tax=Undibacterium flavidum TaxID=2762297 RepID=A0ABR6YAA4_9BURK|nr:hypothetical protein [Undibacterium flavidum]MBC3873497.1 hypothetical protein [Undibacterium flavidum]
MGFVFTIQELNIDSKFWRIDWFGSVSFSENYRRSSQPKVEVQLSQILDHEIDTSVNFDLENIKKARKRTVRLPVGLLSALKIGDIWKNGALSMQPEYEVMSFNQLKITRDTSSLIKAGLPDPETGEYFLPMSHHPQHMEHTQSYCVHIKTNACHIIVPCVELIRFYFGSSSTVLAKIFDAPFAQENFWMSTENTSSTKPTIHLAPGIPGFSAPHIGRIAFSKVARSAAELIGNSCITATARNEPAFPKAVFPFEGETDLVVSGKWLPFNGNSKGVFLVFSLISCSHPFPFKEIKYTSTKKSTSKSGEAPKTDLKAKQEKSELQYSKARQTNNTVIDEEPDKKRVAQKISTQHSSAQFPDLIRKSITKIENEHVPTLMLRKEGISVVDGLSVGDEGNLSTIHPIEFSDYDDEDFQIPKSTNKKISLTSLVFFELLKRIRRNYQHMPINLVRLDSRQRFNYLSTMPRIVNEDGELLSSCVMSFPESSNNSKAFTRNRQISVARIIDACSCIYLIVPEMSETTKELELHVILDKSKTIRTNQDLLAAIGIHFSKYVETESNYELGQGAISTVHKAELLDVQNSHELIAEIFHSAVSGMLTQEFKNACKDSSSTLIDKKLNALTLN